ncbi:MAG: phosphotransferase, partial [Pseudomonadota bacterium]
MKERSEAKRAFLAAAGWGEAAIAPLAGDASNRRYERLSGGPSGARAVLMDAPADRGEDIGIFLAFTGLLRDLGFSAPEVYAADLGTGFAIIEDLGDALYTRLCESDPTKEHEIYAAAIDMLAAMAATELPSVARGSGAKVTLAPYNAALMVEKAALAPEWWLKAAAGASASADQMAEFKTLANDAFSAVGAERGTLALRDFHAENLIWLPDREGAARVGLLDYQDALISHPGYDLVSLLEDARRDLSPGLAETMKARFVELTCAEPAEFDADYAALGAQRNLRIMGVFGRLWLRDG